MLAQKGRAVFARTLLTLALAGRYNSHARPKSPAEKFPESMKHSRTRLARTLFALALALTLCGVGRAQQRPLITEDVDVLAPGTLRVEAGIDFMQDARFPASGLTGDLTRVGVIGVHVGLSPNVEFSIEGVAQNFLSINTRRAGAFPLEIAPGANSTNDTGDFRLATKIKLRNETRRGPARHRVARRVPSGPAREGGRAALRRRRHQGPHGVQPALGRHLRRYLRHAFRLHPRQVEAVSGESYIVNRRLLSI